MGGTAGFVHASLTVVTFLGKSSPWVRAAPRLGGFRRRARRGHRRC